MNNLQALFVGELQRMKRYHILAASSIVALIWIGILHFTKIREVSTIFPLLIFIDATSMSLLMIGVTMFFEKQEGTFRALLVSPIGKLEYILAKTFANVVSNIITLFLLYLYARLFKEISVNIIGLLGSVILIATFHSLVGFILTYYAKDFTGLLIGMLKYNFVFMIPVLLEQVGIIKNEVVAKLLYAVPLKASMLLLRASVGGMEPWKIYFSCIYLIAAVALIFIVAIKKFDEFAVKESGV